MCRSSIDLQYIMKSCQNQKFCHDLYFLFFLPEKEKHGEIERRVGIPWKRLGSCILLFNRYLFFIRGGKLSGLWSWEVSKAMEDSHSLSLIIRGEGANSTPNWCEPSDSCRFHFVPLNSKQFTTIWCLFRILRVNWPCFRAIQFGAIPQNMISTKMVLNIAYKIFKQMPKRSSSHEMPQSLGKSIVGTRTCHNEVLARVPT